MINPLTIEQIVPGGMRPDDHVHVETNDGTCSRCRRAVPEDDVPLTVWNDTAERMWIYCEACLGVQREGAA